MTVNSIGSGSGSGPRLALHIPGYTTEQLEEMGETPTTVGGTPGWSSSFTMTTLGPSANALTSSDLNLISAATGAQLISNPDGILMAQTSTQSSDSQNFVNAIVALRQSIGPKTLITPMMLAGLSKQNSTSSTPFPQDYVTNATGYLSGLG